MFCLNCGKELAEGTSFCGNCGMRIIIEEGISGRKAGGIEEKGVSESDASGAAAEEVRHGGDVDESGTGRDGAGESAAGRGGDEENKKKRRKFTLIGLIVLAVVLIIILVNAVSCSSSSKFDQLIDTGNRYLTEMDYEQAIVAFTAAIEIDANLADAYLGRAEAYAAAGTAESSEEYLTLAASDYTVIMEMYEDEEIPGEIYASRGDVYYALAALVESSDEAVADEYLSAAVSDYASVIDFGGAAEEVYIRVAEIYILQEEYYRSSNVITKGLDVYPESEKLLALSKETETLIEEAEEAARLAAEQAALEAEQAALDDLAEEYLETARAYEEAGELNAAIHTLYEAYSDDLWGDYDESLWDYYEEFYEEWKRIFVPITAICLYNSEGELVDVATYEYDDSKRIVEEYYDQFPVDEQKSVSKMNMKAMTGRLRNRQISPLCILTMSLNMNLRRMSAFWELPRMAEHMEAEAWVPPTVWKRIHTERF